MDYDTPSFYVCFMCKIIPCFLIFSSFFDVK